MDQPYSRIADSLLDYRYWSPNDPQQTALRRHRLDLPGAVQRHVVRVTDIKVLDAPMEKVDGDVRAKGAVADSGIDLPRQPQRRRRTRDASLPAEGRRVRRRRRAVRGRRTEVQSRLVHHQEASSADVQKAAADLGLQIVAVASAPSVKTHPVRPRASRCMHTWVSTQDRRLVAEALDNRRCRTRTSARRRSPKDDNLSAKYDVILFRAGRTRRRRRSSTACRCTAIRCRGRRPRETPNLGSEDQTDDMRPGLGWIGVAHLQDFVRKGGVLLTVDGHGRLRRIERLHAGAVDRAARSGCKIIGSVVRSKMVDNTSPIAYGYTDNLAIWCENGPIFNVSNSVGGGGGRRLGGDARTGRPAAAPRTIRTRRRDGAGVEIAAEPKVETWQTAPSHRRAAAKRHQHHSARAAPARRPAIRRHPRPARVGSGGKRRRDRAACGGRRRAGRQRSRRCFLEQPDVARRNPGQLLPGVQRNPEFRSAERGRKLDPK